MFFFGGKKTKFPKVGAQKSHWDIFMQFKQTQTYNQTDQNNMGLYILD